MHNYADINMIMFICLERKCTILLLTSVSDRILRYILKEVYAVLAAWLPLKSVRITWLKHCKPFKKFIPSGLIWPFVTDPC